MIRHGDLAGRTSRIIARLQEVQAMLPVTTGAVRHYGLDGRPVMKCEDPLGLDLVYPVRFVAVDAETGREVPISALMWEDDPNLVVVSLVAEYIADESDDVVFIEEVWKS